jgi:hypothetical protein
LRRERGKTRRPRLAQAAAPAQGRARAFSSEVDTGSREENALKKNTGARSVNWSSPSGLQVARRGGFRRDFVKPRA